MPDTLLSVLWKSPHCILIHFSKLQVTVIVIIIRPPSVVDKELDLMPAYFFNLIFYLSVLAHELKVISDKERQSQDPNSGRLSPIPCS